MHSPIENISDISKAIQLALGPVFLLTGIAGMLNVMSGRLSRIIDRGRALTEGKDVIANLGFDRVEDELKSLEQRRHLTSQAITMCTISALLVCLVVASLFIEVMFQVPLDWAIGFLFTFATIALIAGLVFFLGEVHKSARTIRIRHSKS